MPINIDLNNPQHTSALFAFLDKTGYMMELNIIHTGPVAEVKIMDSIQGDIFEIKETSSVFTGYDELREKLK